VDEHGFEARVDDGGRGELHVAEAGVVPPETRSCGGVAGEGNEGAAFVEVSEEAEVVGGGVGI